MRRGFLLHARRQCWGGVSFTPSPYQAHASALLLSPLPPSFLPWLPFAAGPIPRRAVPAVAGEAAPPAPGGVETTLRSRSFPHTAAVCPQMLLTDTKTTQILNPSFLL